MADAAVIRRAMSGVLGDALAATELGGMPNPHAGRRPDDALGRHRHDGSGEERPPPGRVPERAGHEDHRDTGPSTPWRTPGRR